MNYRKCILPVKPEGQVQGYIFQWSLMFYLFGADSQVGTWAIILLSCNENVA